MSSSRRTSGGNRGNDVQQSISQLLGKHVKILHKASIKIENSKHGLENRILVLSSHRLFILMAKVPSRIDYHFHYLEIKRIESKSFGFITLTLDKSSFKILEDGEDSILEILFEALSLVFPNVSLEKLVGPLSISPPERAFRLLSKSKELKNILGPCGNFSLQYASYCDYYGLPLKEEVSWDVNTIYFSHDSRELSLVDFEHLDFRDILVILSALEHNTWFTKLKVSPNMSKISSELNDRLCHLVSSSSSLTELFISGIGARSDFGIRLGAALSSNTSCALSSFDLSFNPLEDKGLTALFSSFVSSSSSGLRLRHLNLSYCSLSSKGLQSCFQSLLKSPRGISEKSSPLSSLTYLNLSGNSLKDFESCVAFHTFLSHPSNALTILDVSGTEIGLESLFVSLSSGCTLSLSHLNLSRNSFSKKIPKTEDILSGPFKEFFANTRSLVYINLSSCKVPPEALKHLLLGLACNESLSGVELNLSANNLGALGSGVLESCISGVKCLSRLDLSDNNIESEMSGVLLGVAKNKSLLSLNLSKNLNALKAKYSGVVLDSFVSLLQDETASLSKLNISDCKLKSDTNSIINALGSNSSLEWLDVSGNGMGDSGARLLSKALQINSRLKRIVLDRNGISLGGYSEILYALRFNRSLRHIPYPTYDLSHSLKTHPERVDSLFHKLQETLLCNSKTLETVTLSSAQAFRLSQSFLHLGSNNGLLDKLSESLNDSILNYSRLSKEGNSKLVARAKSYLNESQSSKNLLFTLHDVSLGMKNEIERKLENLSKDLTFFLQDLLERNYGSMLSLTQKSVPLLYSSHYSSSSKESLESRHIFPPEFRLPPNFVPHLLSSTVSPELGNKMNEISLSVANVICDRVLEEVLESLSSLSKALLSEIETARGEKEEWKKEGETKKSRDSEKNNGGGGGEDSSLLDSFKSESSSSYSSPLSTPNMTHKRKTLLERKLRPKSSQNDGSTKSFASSSFPSSPPPSSSSSIPLSASSLKGSSIDEEESSSTLNSVSLVHLGKGRPKRFKKHAPSRGALTLPPTESLETLNHFFPSPSSPSSFHLQSSKSVSTLLSSPTFSSSSSKLSCLRSSALSENDDEIYEEYGSVDESAKSPERKSPSLSSLSGYFSKSRKSPESKRKKSRENEENKGDEGGGGEDEGKKGFEEKCHRLGDHVLAEIKLKQEKRISGFQFSNQTSSEELSPIFGKVKLRATGVCSDSRVSPNGEIESDNGGGSIVGLRTSKLSLPSQKDSSPPSSSSESLKPKPLPKPRPWSIVGLDRKSGESSSVGGTEGKKSSVRDLINNMNKKENIHEKRKGNSLPRVSKDESPSADSTSDDPRILKLEEDEFPSDDDDVDA